MCWLVLFIHKWFFRNGHLRKSPSSRRVYSSLVSNFNLLANSLAPKILRMSFSSIISGNLHLILNSIRLISLLITDRISKITFDYHMRYIYTKIRSDIILNIYTKITFDIIYLFYICFLLYDKFKYWLSCLLRYINSC